MNRNQELLDKIVSAFDLEFTPDGRANRLPEWYRIQIKDDKLHIVHYFEDEVLIIPDEFHE